VQPEGALADDVLDSVVGVGGRRALEKPGQGAPDRLYLGRGGVRIRLAVVDRNNGALPVVAPGRVMSMTPGRPLAAGLSSLILVGSSPRRAGSTLMVVTRAYMAFPFASLRAQQVCLPMIALRMAKEWC
jgi:hypothetical protein